MPEVRSKILKTLDFLRLLDENATLSLSNIAVIIVLIKLALTPSLDYAAIALLLGTLSAYNFKRWTQRSKRVAEVLIPDNLKDIDSELIDIKSEIVRLKLASGFIDDVDNL